MIAWKFPVSLGGNGLLPSTRAGSGKLAVVWRMTGSVSVIVAQDIALQSLDVVLFYGDNGFHHIPH